MRILRALGVMIAVAARAAEPTLTHVYPVAGQQGTTVTVTVTGKFEPWPPQVWVDAPGIVFKAGEAKGQYDVGIAADAAVGPHLVRLFNEQGASAPRFFIVSGDAELREVEPNDHFSAPQKVAHLPATIGGRLDKAGDVDSFAVTLRRGETLRAWLDGYVLASTFDGLVRIVDEQGTPMAFNHDGPTLDPLLAWTAPRDGTFIVQVMGFVYPATASVAMTGGTGCVYRLHLTTGAAPRSGFDGSEIAEREPNDARAAAQVVEIPGTIAGRIEKSGDEDRFAFTAVKQRAYALQVIAAQAGSELDAWVKIESKEGKELARGDDTAGSRDPQLTWTATSDGVVTVALGDVTHRGGDAFGYRLMIAEAEPTVTATMAGHSISIAPGKTGEAKVSIKRANGFKAKLKLAAKNLPEGVAAPEVEVPEKGGDVSLKFSAEAEAKPASQSVQLILRETESGVEHSVRHFLTTKSENNGVPAGYTELVIDSTDQIWLTISGPPVKAAPPK